MRFCYYPQLDSLDCGPSSLRMVAKYYGKSYTIQYLRSKSFITKSGVSMLGINDAAASIGFHTRGYFATLHLYSYRGTRCLPPTLRSGQDRVTQPPRISGPLLCILADGNKFVNDVVSLHK